MNFKRFATLFIVLTLLLTGVAPVLANNTPAGQTAVAQGGFDLLSVIQAYMPTIPAGFGAVRADDLAIELVENPPFLLDVREDNEWDQGFIEGAVHVPLRELAQHLDLLPGLDDPIVVYCASGHRGAIGMTVLQVLGYTNVRNLAGGINAWTGAGYELANEPVEPEAGAMPDIDPALVEAADNYLQNVLPQGWGVVRVDDLAIELVENPPFLLDVRETGEWDANGYIEGAVNIPLREVADNLDMIPTDQPIVVYCAAGQRGAMAMTVLQMLGYEDVRNLAGGFSAWVAAGYDVVGGEGEGGTPQTGGFDLLSVIQAYMPTIPAGFGAVRADDLAIELVENPPFLLDVREDNEWDQGFIEGAVHVPLRELAQHLDLLPGLDDPIVVYCASGHRGAIGMTVLQVLGYTNVRNLAGGINAWTGAGYELANEPVEPEAGAMPDIDPALVEAADNYLQNVLPQGWGVVRPDDLAIELVENPPFLLDVRETSEWDANGYIEGAVNIPLREVADNLDMIPTDQPIVVYCAAGQRGAMAMTVLQMLGYEDVRNLAGGFNGWVAAGYDVVGGGEAAAAPVEVEVVLPEGTVMTADALQPIVFETVETIALSQGFATITEDTLVSEMGDVVIVDVREPNEYEGGHIEGAINLPIRELAQDLYMLPDFSEPIVVYCSAGHRGALGLMALDLLGYENVTSLRSGLRGWSGELVTTAASVTPGEFPAVDPDMWATVDAYLSNLPAGFGTISAEDLSLALTENPPFLIDVREASEYESGHIEDAINMPTRSFTEYADDMPAPDTAIVMYGSIGHRSALTMMALQMLGYEDVRSLGGGSNAWVGAGYEMVTD